MIPPPHQSGLPSAQDTSGTSSDHRAPWHRPLLVAMLLFLPAAYLAGYGALRATGYFTRGENMDCAVTMFTPDAVYGDGEIISMRAWSDSKTERAGSLSGALLRFYRPLIELEVRARWRCGWLPTR